jgi:hypothetical protein
MDLKNRYLGITTALILISIAAGPAIADGEVPGLGPPPGSYTITGSEPVRIPFTMYMRDIKMDCEINGVRCQMLLDNGVLWDELMFFGNDTCDSLGFVLEGEGMSVGGAGEGEPLQADAASDVTLTYPGIEFAGQPAVVMRKEAGMGDWWPGVEGQVSAVFFKHFVTEINFDESVIILHRPETFKYSGKGQVVPLTQLPDGSWMFPATVQVTEEEDPIDCNLILDLGTGNAVDIFTGSHTGIAIPSDAQEKILGYGVQGAIRGHVGVARSIKIAGLELNDVYAGFQEPDGKTDNGQVGMIGMPFFQRFTVIFDYPGGRMILEPGSRFAEPFEDPFADTD